MKQTLRVLADVAEMTLCLEGGITTRAPPVPGMFNFIQGTCVANTPTQSGTAHRVQWTHEKPQKFSKDKVGRLMERTPKSPTG